MNMNNAIRKRFRIRYEGYITKNKYEVVALDYNGYIIGFNFNKEDGHIISGWPQKDGRYGNKYNWFWLIGKGSLIQENNSLGIE